MPEKAFISLGSNVAAGVNLPRAAAHLARLSPLRGVSRVYHTRPVGPPGQPPFLNAAVLLVTELVPLELRRTLRRLEADLGRVRSRDPYARRTIDLDLCLLGDAVVNHGAWRLPDPDLLTRAYLARVVAELEPGFPHPVTGENLGSLAARLDRGRELRIDERTTAALRALL